MDWPGGESQETQSQAGALPRFPRIWVGYLLGVATLIAEMIAASLHPELLKEPLLVPPLYLFLANFVSLVYWLVCGYEFDLFLTQAEGGESSLKTRRAVPFFLMSLFGVCWALKMKR